MLSPPPYRDTDVASLRSAAPSYTSSLPPTYTPRRYSSLLPPAAGGPSTSTPSLMPAHHTYTVASWPSLSNQSQSRAFLNVAARRARRAQEEEAGVVRHDPSPPPPPPPPARRPETREETEAALRMESRSWDFFTAQMTDWQKRQVSWNAFKARYESRKNARKAAKGRRWGFYGRLG